MKINNKGFTLVELLAVIVILGLLMAIAIPSVTKYITQSRVKTLVSTMDSYITAVVTQVNDGEYKFSDSTKIYAIPIECVSLEKGGQSPFGNWMQANENYWAYVLVHYDSENYNYQYGFTFKDDAGYGLYPTLNGLITNSMVKTGYDDLKQPKNGDAIDFVPIYKWEGFDNITADTELVVLESASEGETGDGVETCTLCQKGDNYDEIEEGKPKCRDINGAPKNVGDLITCGEENFYIISVDDSSVTMLSKYRITETTSNPVQAENLTTTSCFSTSSYWSSNSFAYNSKSSLYPYVEAYEKYLQDIIGVKSASASLISKEQLLELGCSVKLTSRSCADSPYVSFLEARFLWWTGSSFDTNGKHYLYYFTGNGRGTINITDYCGARGIRPVVTILKTEIR